MAKILAVLLFVGEVGAKSDPLIWRFEGLKLLEQGQVGQAVSLLEQAKAALPDDTELRLALGGAYLKLQKHQQALIDFSQVLKQKPNHLEANLGRAQALIGLGDAPKAVGPAKLVTEVQPEHTHAWIILGDAYAHESTQDYPRAVQAYQRAIGFHPKSLEIAMKLAKALNHKKETEKAIEVLKHARNHHPNDLTLKVKLAECYFVMRKLDLAEELVSQVLNVNQNHTAARRVLSQVRGRKAYEFWVPVLALVAFPMFYFLVRWMKRGRILKA